MKLAGKKVGTWGFFFLEGSVISTETKVFVDGFSQFLERSGPNIIMDLSQCSFLSIGAIRFLNQKSLALQKAGGRLCLLGMNDRIRKHIDIFVSWKSLREISSPWQVIPLQMKPLIDLAPLLIYSANGFTSASLMELEEAAQWLKGESAAG